MRGAGPVSAWLPPCHAPAAGRAPPIGGWRVRRGRAEQQSLALSPGCPVMLRSAPRPREITFPEDKLFAVYKRRNPDWDKEVIKMHPKARANGEKTRGYLFCNLWQNYILEGIPQEEAYVKVEAEFKVVEDKIREEERKVLREQIRQNKVPILMQRWEDEEPYVQEAFAFHKKQWEQRRAKRLEKAEDQKALEESK